MELDVQRLMDEARASGEAFLPFLSKGGARAGVGATLEGGRVTLELEVQLRLLPSRSPVDVPTLRKMVGAAVALHDGGFRLHHFEDGWVVATMPVPEGEVDGAARRVGHALLAVD